MIEKKRVGVISLGCDKNRVDTEKMLSFLTERHLLENDIEKAQIIIINTCAFLESSRREALEEILSSAQYKVHGQAEKLIVTGCLPQKFIDEIFDELTEVDAFLGVSDYAQILSVIEKIYSGERVNAVGMPRGECTKRRTLTTCNYAYLKVADGCSNHCTYCLIPYIRGKYRSVPLNDLIEEAKLLGEVKELILVAQDTARYGYDLTPKCTLVQLIKELSLLDNIHSIRLLYCYPENITDELIEELKNNDKLIKYLDVPMQHADDRVLKLMNRKGTGKSYLELVKKLKAEVEGIAIRSTFITGVPTESDQEFLRLTEFLQEAKLFNAGFFKYSKEDGTAAARLSGQIPASVKEKRLRKLYSVQKKIVKDNLKEFIGKTLTVTAEGFDENELVYFGRAYFSAPDVDGKVYFFSADEVVSGENYAVKIIKATGYDLYGERL